MCCLFTATLEGGPVVFDAVLPWSASLFLLCPNRGLQWEDNFSLPWLIGNTILFSPLLCPPRGISAQPFGDLWTLNSRQTAVLLKLVKYFLYFYWMPLRWLFTYSLLAFLSLTSHAVCLTVWLVLLASVLYYAILRLKLSKSVFLFTYPFCFAFLSYLICFLIIYICHCQT